MKASPFYLCLLLVFSVTVSYSQQTTLFASNQNPRYKESLDKYVKLSDSVTRWHSLTFQETYKAYDWYEAKQERKQQRREWRHLERMNNRYRFNSYRSAFNPFDNYYINPWQRPYHRYSW